MDFYEIFVRSPVNGEAAKMLAGSDNIESSIDKDELIYLIDRLQRKRRLLNMAIGVRTKAQRKNLMWKINKNKPTYRGALNARGVEEWRRNGLAIRRLQAELERRGEYDVQQSPL